MKLVTNCVLVIAAVLSLSTVAHADTIQVFTDQVAVGQPYGLELCEISCIPTPYVPADILEEVSFVNTGMPQTETFAATDANVDLIIADLINPNPDPDQWLKVIGDGNGFGGGILAGDTGITGMVFQIDGLGNATYSVTGVSTPEAGTMLLTMLGLVGVLTLAAVRL